MQWKNEKRRLADLQPWARNPRQITHGQAERLVDSFGEFGQIEPLAIGPDNEVYNGHQRLAVLLQEHGPDYEIEVRVATEALTESQREKLTIYLHKGAAGDWNFDTLANEFELEDLLEWGFEEWELGLGNDGDNAEVPDAAVAATTLAERFIVPPFTVLDARQGYWQARKRAWIDMGIKGELGREQVPKAGGTPSNEGDLLSAEYDNRKAAISGSPMPHDRSDYGRTFGQDLMKGENAKFGQERSASGNYVDGVLMTSDSGNDPRYYFKKQQAERELGRTLTTEEFQRDYYDGPDSYQAGTSIFDPVLCEIAYRWFCTPGGHILDPFAGEATKGLVAGYLDYGYTGIELRQEQVDANEGQAHAMGLPARWVQGDSADLDQLLPEGALYDLVFTSPPYYDLEIYSASEKDGSAFATYDTFMVWYEDIFRQAVARLQPNRFLVVKVGEIRDEKGLYRNFVGDNISIFKRLGLHYYNEAILVTAVGSLAIRVGKQFSGGRKLGKTHQNILVFFKGDPKAIKSEFPEEVQHGDPFAESESEAD